MRIRALFWDVGGVLLSNGWDLAARRQAARRFGLDEAEFGERHGLIEAAFETGRLSLDEYMERTVFHTGRDFEREAFRAFMLSQSRANEESLAMARAFARSDRYLMATLNNESRELNEHRIRAFDLASLFQLFISSCYVGYRKPENRIYRLALDLVQLPPQECLFIDDRPLNLECAGLCGMNALLYRNADALRSDLARWGVSP